MTGGPLVGPAPNRPDWMELKPGLPNRRGVAQSLFPPATTSIQIISELRCCHEANRSVYSATR